jgi:tRNA (cytidine/uridine-2'-O-)-methyltransferase
MNIVLLEPEIPQNTGNIGRTCMVSGTRLHLVGPMGFSVDDKYLKRSGLDYWLDLDVRYYQDFDDFLSLACPARMYMATTKARRLYTDISYSDNDYIVFGKESAGIPEELLLQYRDTAIRIPMLPASRSLNLSSSVAIVLYEAMRQQNFAGFQIEGALHKYSW